MGDQRLGTPDRHRASPEARRLLDLRYRLSALTADEYCRAGFAAVAQDNIYGQDVTRWLDRITAGPRHLVVLRPSADIVARRDAERLARTGKLAYRPGGLTIDGLDGDQRRRRVSDYGWTPHFRVRTKRSVKSSGAVGMHSSTSATPDPRNSMLVGTRLYLAGRPATQVFQSHKNSHKRRDHMLRFADDVGILLAILLLA